MLEMAQGGRKSAQLFQQQQYWYNMYTQTFAKLSNLLEGEEFSHADLSEVGSKRRLLLL